MDGEHKSASRQALKRVIPWLLGAAALAISLPAAVAWGFTHPPRRFPRRSPRHLRAAFRRIRLRTSDGLRLAAWYVPAPAAPRGIVVLCHGYYGNRASMLDHVGFLHPAGYATLLFDFRAHGWSGGSRVTLGAQEKHDLTAALDWISAQPELAELPLTVLGQSMGGAVALLTAANDARVDAVVTDSAFARLDEAVASRLRLSFGPLAEPLVPPAQRIGESLLGVPCVEIAPDEAIARIAPRPVLLIHGLDDRLIHPENAQRLLCAAPDIATLWEVPGAAHCFSIDVAGQEYAHRVIRFLETVAESNHDRAHRVYISRENFEGGQEYGDNTGTNAGLYAGGGDTDGGGAE